jgi:hypothetical protein
MVGGVLAASGPPDRASPARREHLRFLSDPSQEAPRRMCAEAVRINRPAPDPVAGQLRVSSLGRDAVRRRERRFESRHRDHPAPRSRLCSSTVESCCARVRVSEPLSGAPTCSPTVPIRFGPGAESGRARTLASGQSRPSARRDRLGDGHADLRGAAEHRQRRTQAGPAPSRAPASPLLARCSPGPGSAAIRPAA